MANRAYRRPSAWLAPSLFALPLLLTGAARAQNIGVSDERVSLPDGPGSIGGVGNNIEINPAMGSMSHSVTVEVPRGWPGLAPSIALSYSSAAGSGNLGIGWSMETPSIERASVHRYPKYDTSDEFVVDGSELLVAAGQLAGTPVYRARIEGGFVRYQWRGAANGKAGYWTAERPDGIIAYYGADPMGMAVSSAQVIKPGDTGVFRYHLVAAVDRYGHQLRYKYRKTQLGYSQIDSIEWDDEGGQPRSRVTFDYEKRPDLISDARPGFELVLDERLVTVSVYSGAQKIRRYQLTYEADMASGGFSRLSKVQQYGVGDVLNPIQWSFTYSQSLGGSCTGLCNKPFLVDMGHADGAALMQAGSAIFLDMNGDALPDMLASDAKGVHSIQLAKLDPKTAKPSFDPAVRQSAATPANGSLDFVIGPPQLQVLDLNGDGLVDLVNAKTGKFLCNAGNGDWSAKFDCMQTGGANAANVSGLAGLSLLDNPNGASADAVGTRFFDYDGDHDLDLMFTTADGNGAVIYPNLKTGFGAPITIDPIQGGAGFDAPNSTLQLADMNGDNLQDAVRITMNQVSYRLATGYGHWGPSIDVAFNGFDALLTAQLVDINGDGLSDVVSVVGNKIQFALNRNGKRFDSVVSITANDVMGGVLPVISKDVTSTFADMDGNGSLDIVYIDRASSSVSFLELFPARPNLLVRIENGIGMVQTVAYGTSVAEQARDTANQMPWAYKLPNAMNVVTSTDTWVTLTPNVHEVVNYRYRDGYYEGVERSFRGYGHVEEERPADPKADFQEPSLTVQEFIVGKDAYYNTRPKERWDYGPLVSTTVPLRHTVTEWGEKPVAEIPAGPLAYDIKHVVMLSETTDVAEGVARNQVTLRKEWDYDGYGNVTLESNLGVVGANGDEEYHRTEYIAPGMATGGAWILDRPWRQTHYGDPAKQMSSYHETITLYDKDFDGLPQGQLTKGTVTHVKELVAPGMYVDKARRALDADGRATDELDPLGSPAEMNGHRMHFAWDGLDLIHTSVPMSDATGAYSLDRTYTYDASFHKVSEATDTAVYVAGKAAGFETSQKFRYDEHARLTRSIRTPDADATPTVQVTYELGDPVTRLLVSRRSTAGGAADILTVQCLDGRGRTYQTRVQLAPGRFQVSGFQVFNKQGKPVRHYQPWISSSDACDKSESAVPMGTLSSTYVYDALDRLAQINHEDGTQSRTVFEPLATRTLDEDDLDPMSPNRDTPLVTRTDGLGRVVAHDRYLTTSTIATTSYHWDDLGRMDAITDAKGNRRGQGYDLLDRVVTVSDPNAGELHYSYDAAGNLVEHRSAVVTRRFAYDGMNRQVASWSADDDAGTRITALFDRTSGCADCTITSGRLAELRYPLGKDAVGDAAGVDRFGYDARGNLLYRSQKIEGHLFETRFAYDDADRLVKKTLPDGRTEEVTFDAAARPTSVTGVLPTISYDERSLLASVSRANGVIDSWSYDQRMRPAGIKVRSGSATLFALDLTRDPDGTLRSVIDRADARPGRLLRGLTVTSDAWHRALGAALDDSGGAESISTEYDAIDNVTAVTSSAGTSSSAHVGMISYDPGRPNAAARAGSMALSYDAAGRMTGRGAVTLTRDLYGRVARATQSGVPDEISVYAGQSQRVMKLEGGGVTYYLDPGFEVRDGIGVAYTWLGDGRAARRASDAIAPAVLSDLAPATDGAGGLSPVGDKHITVADAWLAQAAAQGIVKLAGGPAPSPVGRLLRASCRRLLLDDGEPLVQLHRDEVESVVMATDAKGGVLGERSFYPTGLARKEIGFVDIYGFTGHELDAGSGLIHFGHRDLDPVTGRWDRGDPAFEVLGGGNVTALGQSTTGYAYVANAPFDHIDPSGLFGEKIKAAWGKLTGGGNRTNNAGNNARRGGNGGGQRQRGNQRTRETNERVRSQRRAEMDALFAKSRPRVVQENGGARLDMGELIPALMDDPRYAQSWENHSRRMAFDESHEYLRRVADVMAAPTQENTQALYHDYVRRGGTRELNVDDATRIRLTNAFTNPNSTATLQQKVEMLGNLRSTAAALSLRAAATNEFVAKWIDYGRVD